MFVAQAQKAVFPPPVHARAGVVMREGAPGIAVGGVVLPHRAPLTIRQVATPKPPGHQPLIPFGHAALFGALNGSGIRHQDGIYTKPFWPRSALVQAALCVTPPSARRLH